MIGFLVKIFNKVDLILDHFPCQFAGTFSPRLSDLQSISDRPFCFSEEHPPKQLHWPTNLEAKNKLFLSAFLTTSWTAEKWINNKVTIWNSWALPLIFCNTSHPQSCESSIIFFHAFIFNMIIFALFSLNYHTSVSTQQYWKDFTSIIFYSCHALPSSFYFLLPFSLPKPQDLVAVASFSCISLL